MYICIYIPAYRRALWTRNGYSHEILYMYMCKRMHIFGLTPIYIYGLTRQRANARSLPASPADEKGVLT